MGGVSVKPGIQGARPLGDSAKEMGDGMELELTAMVALRTVDKKGEQGRRKGTKADGGALRVVRKRRRAMRLGCVHGAGRCILGRRWGRVTGLS